MSATHFTLQDGYQSGADAGHDVTEQPLFEAVDSEPADDRQEGESRVLGSFGVTSEGTREHQ